MKVVHISSSDRTGAGLCAYRIFESQRKAGIEANLLVLDKSTKSSFVHDCSTLKYFFMNFFRKMHWLGGDYKELDKIKKIHNGTFSLPISFVDLSKHRLVMESDVVHIHGALGFLDYESFFKAIGKEKKIVMTLHDENLFLGISHYVREQLKDCDLELKYKSIKEQALGSASRLGIVFLSKMMYDTFSGNPICHNHKVSIINNSVDYSRYLPVDRNLARKKLGIDPDMQVVCFCAYNIYDSRKGLDVLSKALMKINPNHRILAIGKNKLSSKKSKYANVIDVGRVRTPEQMSELMSAADCFCMPSYQEAFAQTPLEAMSCGLPLVVFPCSGTQEIINDITGIRCGDFTEDELIAALNKAFSQEYDSEKIRNFVIDNYSPEKICKDYIDFYNSL